MKISDKWLKITSYICAAFFLFLLLNIWFFKIEGIFFDIYTTLFIFAIVGFVLLPFMDQIKFGNILELKRLKNEIKHDANEVKEIRNEVEQIRTQLRRVTKVNIENTYILASLSMLAMGGEQAARSRLEKNMNELSKFAEPIIENKDKWWSDLQNLFPERQKSGQ